MSKKPSPKRLTPKYIIGFVIIVCLAYFAGKMVGKQIAINQNAAETAQKVTP